MKNKIFSICTLFLVTFSAATCKKENTLEMELAKLPPATQTGQNTFGCLVNGKAWVAQNKDCFPYCDPSFKMDYDGTKGGVLTLQAFLKNSKERLDQVIIISFDSSNFTVNHSFNDNNSLVIALLDYKAVNNCGDLKSLDSITSSTGTVILTYFNLPNNIVSGTFEFTLFKPGCDTIKVTHGRFDKKL